MAQHETFIIIPESIQKTTGIDWPHRAIWGIVYAFSCNGGECWLSVDQIAERIHRKRRQTSSMIQTLIDLNLIEIASFNGRKRSLRTVNLDQFSNVQNSAHVQSAAHQPREIPHISRAENRTSAARNSAHKEYKEEKREEKNKHPDEKNQIMVISNGQKQDRKGKKSSGQKPESIDECRSYFIELKSDDWESFWDYWSSVGWKRRTGKIVCWKSTARGWVRRNNQNTHERIDKNKPFDAANAITWANQ